MMKSALTIAFLLGIASLPAADLTKPPAKPGALEQAVGKPRNVNANPVHVNSNPPPVATANSNPPPVTVMNGTKPPVQAMEAERKTFTLSPNAKIQVRANADASLSDLRPGDLVHVFYHREGDTWVIDRIGNPGATNARKDGKHGRAGQVTGKVVSLDAQIGSLVIAPLN